MEKLTPARGAAVWFQATTKKKKRLQKFLKKEAIVKKRERRSSGTTEFGRSQLEFWVTVMGGT